MDNKVNKAQRRRFFISNMLAFAGIFIALGLIVFQILRVSVTQDLKDVDQNLLRISKNEQALNQLVSLKENSHGGTSLGGPRSANTMQTDIILWSKDGTILNSDQLGFRYGIFNGVKFDNSVLSKVKSITAHFSNSDGVKRSTEFHSILVPVTSATNEDVAYVQILTNVDSINKTVSGFKRILVICMVVFWLISILVSMYLSKLNMAPIMKSWKKQQEFVENASHELRTPLTIIQSKLEGMFVHPNHTIVDESESIALALNETRRLNKLTTDLLLLARSDSNEVVIHKEPVDVAKFMANVVEPYQEVAQMQEKELTLVNDVHRVIPLDEQRIHQLLVILLDNALKYTEAGAKITVVSEIKNQHWITSVKDTGIGISDEHKKHIFQRFYREDSSRTRETGGYGLGLSIAKWIAESHHGVLSVSDNQPQGTIFQISIPF